MWCRCAGGLWLDAGWVNDWDIGVEGRCVVICRIVGLDELSDHVHFFLFQVQKELVNSF